VIRRPLIVALALLGALVGFAACGERKEPTGAAARERLTLMLDFFPNADHAGIYAAQATGAFDRAGLDVRIEVPSDAAAPLKLLAAGKVDLAISYEPELLLARDQGRDLVGVGALAQRPLTSIMSIPPRAIARPAQLRGKRVGTAGIPYQSAYLKAILAKAGVDPSSVKETNVGFNLVGPLLSRRVDATLGGFWNYEGVQLRLRHKRPKIIPVDDAGVPTYDELVFVANEDALDRDKDKIRAFIGAVSRGARALRDDPGKQVQGLLDANPDLDAKLQREAVKVTLPLFFAPKGKPFGYQSPGEWDAFTAWMRENHLLTKTPSAKGAFTNELLPGSGL
jgi:putative hydroxymethylpyrimidine transport system substrate-binding protein